MSEKIHAYEVRRWEFLCDAPGCDRVVGFGFTTRYAAEAAAAIMRREDGALCPVHMGDVVEAAQPNQPHSFVPGTVAGMCECGLFDKHWLHDPVLWSQSSVPVQPE